MIPEDISSIQNLWQSLASNDTDKSDILRAIDNARRYRCGKLTLKLMNTYRRQVALSFVVILCGIALPKLGFSVLTCVLYLLVGAVCGALNYYDLGLIKRIDSYMGQPCTEAVRNVIRVQKHLSRGMCLGILLLIPTLTSFFYDIMGKIDLEPDAKGMLWGGIAGGVIGGAIGLRIHLRIRRRLRALREAFSETE